MTHPFHPLSGQDFEFVEHKHNWGEDRVWLRGEDRELFSVPAGWTDVVASGSVHGDRGRPLPVHG